MTYDTRWTNTLGMAFCPIPEGEYLRGEGGTEPDERPAHRVVLTRPFAMQETPVTNSQYEQFDKAHARLRGKDYTSAGDDDACTHVSYGEAVAFADWLSQREGKPYRLPTEAEWEYACRAGTHTLFSCGDELPAFEFTQEDFFSEAVVDLRTGINAPNAFGLHDMHGLVEEWCLDWYAPYPDETVYDPYGPKEGLYRVTRGGSVNTPAEYLRSANRMAALADTRNAITGFRLVCSDATLNPIETKPRVRRWQKDVSQQRAAWTTKDAPVFRKPLVFVRPPENDKEGPFYPHNHVPTLAVLDNGDLLAAWFSAKAECGRELTVLAARLRRGSEVWDTADEFYKIADRNMSSTALLHYPDGRLFHFNGVAMSGTEFKLVSVFRVSEDNGVTWSREKPLNPHYSTNKPICAPIVDADGRILVPADMYDLTGGKKGQGTVLFRSNGALDAFEEQTCYERDAENFLQDQGTAGWIAGVHGAVVQRKNGSLLALGRSESRCGRQLLRDKMPMSLSYDMGKSWFYRPSPFPPIGYCQRCCLLRLNEGPIVLYSFTDPQYALVQGHVEGMDLRDAKGNVLHGYGLYAALSFDEGETWPVQRLITTSETPVEYDPGASRAAFTMDRVHAQPEGYLQAVQAPDGVIHLISSRLHYRMNLPWLMSEHAVGVTQERG